MGKPLMSFVDELKRRNVFRVGIAYVVVGWLLIQVAETILPTFNAPQWVLQTITFVILLGFPLALIFAWAFERTPEGLKRERDVDRPQSITPQTGRKLDYLIIALLAVALGYFAFDKFVLDPARDAELVETTAKAAIEQETSPEEAEAHESSIAVLPFVNMSDDASNEFFSDGISEEILNLLAKIPELRVISRTSAFSYKGQNVKASDVARELNVAHILEGSVRKAGNQVRITAQLIEARSDTHLWSETYDRTLDDIFAIHDEIAATVVAQLKVELLGALPTVEVIDSEAYTLYLQGLQANNQQNVESWKQAVELFKQALTIQPNYVAAWIGLANTYHFQSSTDVLPYEEVFELWREAAKEALTIDPANAKALAMLSNVAGGYDLDLSVAAHYMQRALTLDPNNTYVLAAAGWLSRTLGRKSDATSIAQFLVLRDPLNPRVHFELGVAHFYDEKWDEAIASFRAVLRLSPESDFARYELSWALLLKGDFAAALEVAQEQSFEGYRLINLSAAHYALRNMPESDAALGNLIDKSEHHAPHEIASLFALRGDANNAFEWLAKAVEYRDSGVWLIPLEPQLHSLHDDPRWLPFLERIGRSPEQLAAIEFKVTLPE